MKLKVTFRFNEPFNFLVIKTVSWTLRQTEKKKLLNNLKNVSDFNRLSLGDPDRFKRKSPQDHLIFDKLIRGTKDIEIKPWRMKISELNQDWIMGQVI